MQILAVPDRL
ncbi:hypothetical protein YPPY34_2808, partial [Yersinia pestis PY-34]